MKSQHSNHGQLQRTPPTAHLCALQGGRPPKPDVLFRRPRLARKAQGLLRAPRHDLCARAPAPGQRTLRAHAPVSADPRAVLAEARFLPAPPAQTTSRVSGLRLLPIRTTHTNTARRTPHTGSMKQMSTFYCKTCNEYKDSAAFSLRLRKDGTRTPNAKLCKQCRATEAQQTRRTTEYQAWHATYSQSDSRKQSNRKRDRSDKGKLSRQRYAQSAHGKQRIASTSTQWKQQPGIRAQLSMRERLRRLVTIPGYVSSTGIDRAALVARLEGLWLPGMNWDNYGYRDGDYKSGWDWDHVTPVEAYDHTNAADVARCWSLDNLRPEWHRKNLVKGTSRELWRDVPAHLWPQSWHNQPPRTC